MVHEASKGSFSRVFDFEANDVSEEENNTRTSPFESRFPINIGITGHVATTGEVCTNASDVSIHLNLFMRKVPKLTFYCFFSVAFLF